MNMMLIIVGVVMIALGAIRHFMPGLLRKKITLPGYMIAGLGVLLAIAGFLSG